MNKLSWKFDLMDRMTQFSSDVIILSNSFPKTPAGYATASQLVRSATSIGANFFEAQDASTSKEFRQKLLISLREARETFYWFSVIEKSSLLSEKELTKLKIEINEIISILVSIVKKAGSKNDKN